ncbi:MAG: alpha/beta fold hydrolase [Planctomycetota bacterium]
MQLFVPGPEGRLEAILHPAIGVGTPRAVACVCHPHPAHGGNMHSTVAFRVARGLQTAGVTCLRFNFRGVGKSEGTHSGERGPAGEEGDASAALDWLQERHPGVPVWAAGFSFGSRTVFALAKREERIERLLLIGFPLRAFDLPDVDRIAQPTLFVWGEHDEFGTLADLRAAHPVLPEHFTLHVVAGDDHFFRPDTRSLESEVRFWADRQLGGPLS